MSCAPTTERRLSLRWRLTLWSAGAVLAVHAVAGAVLFAAVERMLLAEVDAVLEGEIQEHLARVRLFPSDLSRAQSEIRAELGHRHRGDIRFRLLDDAGAVLIDSSPDALATGDRPPFDGGFDTFSVAGSPTMRTHWKRLALSQGVRWAETTYSLEQVNAGLHGLVWVWAAILPVVGLLAATAGWLAAWRGLRPVTEMAAAAQRVGLDGSGERLAVSAANDELDRLGTTLNRMLDRIAEHVGRMRRFTADAAHEFRTPLAALRGTAEVALSRPREVDELRAVLESAVDQYDRLSRIADDLLLLARADAGVSLLRLEPVELDRVLSDTADLYAPVAESKGVELRVVSPSRSGATGGTPPVRLEDELSRSGATGGTPPVRVEDELSRSGATGGTPPVRFEPGNRLMSESPALARPSSLVLRADGGRLRQLVGNLLDNAIRHTPAGGRIEVSAAATDAGATIIVRDTGSGIDPQHLPHVFERFRRTDDHRAAGDHRGAGLGLSICRTIAELHGGSIGIESTPGAGTIVRVELPKMNEPSSA